MNHAYLSYNIFAIGKQLMVTASVIKQMPRKNTSVTDATHCINEVII
jgi:hypothetical protein